MEPNNLLNCIKAFAKRICATLLAALAVSLLTIGCGDRSAPDANNSDSTRINKLKQIDDSVMTLAPSVKQLIADGIRTAPDSMTAYEYRLREARYLTLTDRPERFKDNIENILRFAEQQQKRELNNAEKRRLNTLIAGAYNCRAAYYHNFHRKQHQAIQLYKAAYSLLANSDSKHNMPKVCANLADAYIQDNNMPMAAQWYRRALFLVDSLALPPKENVTLYMGLAQIYLSLHDFDTALHYYKATEEHFNMMSPSMQAYFLNNFGNYYYFKKNYRQALDKFLRMKQNLERHGMQNNFDMYLCKVNLADVYLNLDSIRTAQRYLDEVEPYFHKRDDFTALHYCKTIRIGIATKTGNIATAQRLIADNDETQHPVQYTLVNLRNRYLQKYYEQVGNFRRAYELLQSNYAYNDSLEHNHSNMRSADIMARFTSDTLQLRHDLMIDHHRKDEKPADTRHRYHADTRVDTHTVVHVHKTQTAEGTDGYYEPAPQHRAQPHLAPLRVQRAEQQDYQLRTERGYGAAGPDTPHTHQPRYVATACRDARRGTRLRGEVHPRGAFHVRQRLRVAHQRCTRRRP